jgi:4-cresol dehydrogenase (hydroxylating)
MNFNDMKVGWIPKARSRGAETDREFLSQVEQAIGADYVVANPEELEKRAQDTVSGAILPLAIVYPKSTAEVQRIVQLANDFGVPIWPHSTGLNWGWSNSPLQEGAVMIILERMNRIISVDENLAYAVIEPGVSYESLNNYLKEHHIKLWADCTAGPPKGSVLGNALDRGVGVTTHGEHFASLCGLEVVLGNGDVLRTGGEATRHTYKWGTGPVLEGLFSQGNLGIVTQGGIWLMPEPEAHVMVGFILQDELHFAELMDRLRKLALEGVIPDKIRLTNDFAVLTLVTQRMKEEVQGKNALTEGDLQQLRGKYHVGRWGFCSSIYGRKEQVRAMRQIIERELSPFGRLVFMDDAKLRRIKKILPYALRLHHKYPNLINFISDKLLKVSLPVLQIFPALYGTYQGVPTEQIVRRAYFRSSQERPEKDVHIAKAQIGLMWFGPMVPLEGEALLDYVNDCRARFRAYDLDCYFTILMLNARTVVPLMGIMYRKEDPSEQDRVKALYLELFEEASRRGYQPFRCGRLGWPLIFKNSPDLLNLNEKIKNLVDPHHIIAPGKYGIA